MDATIVIPTYNRHDALLATLATLARVESPADGWEAVVVDDGSTDATPTVVPEWIARTGAPVRYVRQANAGPAMARNRGAAAARGRCLIFIDNDIGVPHGFVRGHVDALAAHPGCWIVGRIVHPAAIRETPFGRYRDSLWEAFHRAHGGQGIAETTGMSAANVSMPRADFERLGGFDTGFTIASGEDWDLGMRARQAGIRILYHPELAVVHDDWAVDLDRFCERQRLYSISDVLLWRKYGEESPRARLVRENAGMEWGPDGPGLAAKKALKGLLATSPVRAVVRSAATLAERIAPDSRWSHRAYEATVALAIFRGVREGLRRYPAPPGG
jgi:GT2 family glycosyltransferase